MKYIVDNDLHIHTHLSSQDPAQSAERILQYAEENGLTTICTADHFWDKDIEGASIIYDGSDFEHICKIKPLPQSENVRFLFGCEGEVNPDLTLGILKERFDEFDFIVIPTTHFHLELHCRFHQP